MLQVATASIHVTGEKSEEVNIGPGGVRVKDGDSEVKVSWCGVRMRDGRTCVNISVWKPLVGCGFAIILFAAILTAVIVGIVKLMMQ